MATSNLRTLLQYPRLITNLLYVIKIDNHIQLTTLQSVMKYKWQYKHASVMSSISVNYTTLQF